MAHYYKDIILCDPLFHKEIEDTKEERNRERKKEHHKWEIQIKKTIPINLVT